MITLRDFIDLAMEDYYKINVFNVNNGTKILEQVEVGNIEEELENMGMNDYLDYSICSWDIAEDTTKEFTINIG